MFETLLSKTFLILSISLIFCYVGAQGVLYYFQNAYKNGAKYVSAIINKYGQEDLIVEEKLLSYLFWPALILNIAAFILLMIYRNLMPFNMLNMALFTLTDGITIGLVLISIDENIGVKVTKLTVLATLLTAIIGMYSGIDFSFLGGFLFIALIALIIVSIFRLFVSIQGFHRRVIASIGILIFIGYLLYDFNNLHKVKNLSRLNNWNTALDFSISIYLDIINLFLQILDLLSD